MLLLKKDLRMESNFADVDSITKSVKQACNGLAVMSQILTGFRGVNSFTDLLMNCFIVSPSYKDGFMIT